MLCYWDWNFCSSHYNMWSLRQSDCKQLKTGSSLPLAPRRLLKLLEMLQNSGSYLARILPSPFCGQKGAMRGERKCLTLPLSNFIPECTGTVSAQSQLVQTMRMDYQWSPQNIAQKTFFIWDLVRNLSQAFNTDLLHVTYHSWHVGCIAYVSIFEPTPWSPYDTILLSSLSRWPHVSPIYPPLLPHCFSSPTFHFQHLAQGWHIIRSQ